jgi:hypothetical protein
MLIPLVFDFVCFEFQGWLHAIKVVLSNLNYDDMKLNEGQYHEWSIYLHLLLAG